ncbi:MAG: anti-sigma factor, partial [Candidatus Binatia bacterium]
AGAGGATPGATRVARRRISWAMPFAAAALALLAITSYREIGWRADADRLSRRVADLQQALTRASGDLDRIRTVLADREQDVAALRGALAQAEESLSILHTRGLNLVALKETKDAPPAEGHVLLSKPTGRALFYAFDLPQVAADKTYELWWITEKDGPVQAGTFRPDARGLGRIEATLPTNAGAIQAAAVTVEAAGGVPKPQGPMVLLGTVTPS